MVGDDPMVAAPVVSAVMATSLTAPVRVVPMNTWNESIRLANILLRRLRELDERGVRAYFTRDCFKLDWSGWRFNQRIIKCLRAWYIRALVSIAAAIHPLIKAYGIKAMEFIIEGLDLSKVDTRENLLRDLSNLVYDAVINQTMNNTRNTTTGSDVLTSRVINQGIGDLMTQISRIETLLRDCNKDGRVIFEDEELNCEDLWLYDSELHQILNELEKLARKYNISIEPTKHPWRLYE